ncbi:MAG TPA: carbohydrate ABC transporter permease [Chloroflexota bacterium]|nr:carbohydrate ABC transporter permease [Chloroflexota bacterium]
MRVARPLPSDTGVLHSTAVRWSGPAQIWRLLAYATMAVAVVLVGLPMYWMLLAAFKTNQEIFTNPPTWIPLAPTLDNFPAAWRQAPFGHFYVNSLIYTVVSGSAKLLQAVFCAYAFAFLSFPRKNVVFLLLLMALMIPDEFTVLPNFLTLANVGWTDTYQGLLLPGFVSAFGTFLLRQHFLSLPHEVLDAARVDGAGHLRTLWSVVLPMSRPVLATLVLLTAVQRWNDYLWPLIITNSTEMRTLSVGIALLFQKETGTLWGVVMAGTLYVVLPVLILFLLVQRHIVEGIAAGAVKG